MAFVVDVCHGARMNESCHRTSHVTRVKRQVVLCVACVVDVCHGARINESCHTYQ